MSWLGGLKSFQIYSHGNVTEKKESPKQIKTVASFFLPAMPSHFGISVLNSIAHSGSPFTPWIISMTHSQYERHVFDSTYCAQL